MTDFPTDSYTLTCKILTLLNTCLLKREPSWAELLCVGHYREYSPGGSDPQDCIGIQVTAAHHH